MVGIEDRLVGVLAPTSKQWRLEGSGCMLSQKNLKDRGSEIQFPALSGTELKNLGNRSPAKIVSSLVLVTLDDLKSRSYRSNMVELSGDGNLPPPPLPFIRGGYSLPM